MPPENSPRITDCGRRWNPHAHIRRGADHHRPGAARYARCTLRGLRIASYEFIGGSP